MSDAKRPWTVHIGDDYTAIYDADNNVVIQDCGCDLDTVGLIVACVNALAGLNPDAVAKFIKAARSLRRAYTGHYGNGAQVDASCEFDAALTALRDGGGQ